MIRWIRITPQLRECREYRVGGEGLRPPRAELIRVFVCGTWGGVPWDAFTLPSFSLISQQRNVVPREYRLAGKSAACVLHCVHSTLLLYALLLRRNHFYSETLSGFGYTNVSIDFNTHRFCGLGKTGASCYNFNILIF